MIGYLKGTVKLAQDNQVIILCNGIGWSVHTGSRIFIEDSEIELYIHTQVRENDISLWGVTTPIELSLFRLLLGVSGIGGRTAMALITEKGVDAIVSAISFMEAKNLQVSGVGKKTAEKIIIELKDKISHIPLQTPMHNEQKTETSSSLKEYIDEAIEALQNLGYKRQDIDISLTEIRNSPIEISSSEQLIKELLKRL